MALELASMTDTPEQIAEVMREAGYEVTPEPAPAVEAVAEPVPIDPPAPEAPPVEVPAAEAPKPAEAQPPATPAAEDDATLPEWGRKKLNKLERQRGEHKAGREAAEARITTLEAELAALKPKPAEAAKPEVKAAEEAPDPEPKPEDFGGEYDPKFIREQARWEARQETKKTAATLSAKFEQQIADLKTGLKKQSEADIALAEQQERQAAWQDRLTAVRTELPDWDEVIGTAENPSDIPLTPACNDAIMECENAPYLFYWLGKHPEEANRIAAATTYDEKASPAVVVAKNRAAAREIARIEALVEAERSAAKTPAPAPAVAAAPAPAPVPAPKRAPVASKAPPPIEPVGGRPAAGVAGNPKEPVDGWSGAQYRAWKETPEGIAWMKRSN